MIKYIFYLLIYLFYSQFNEIKFFFFNCFSDFLYNNKHIGILLNIKYSVDKDLVLKRNNTQLYIPIIYKLFFNLLFGLNINLNRKEHIDFIQILNKVKHKINIIKYLKDIKSKKLNIIEFENFISFSLLNETNLCLKLLNENDLDTLKKNILFIRELLLLNKNPFFFNIKFLIFLYKNLYCILDLYKIIRKLKKEELFIYIGPIFSITKKLIEYILSKNGDLSSIKFSELIRRTNTFSGNYMIFIIENQFTFITITKDETDNSSNLAFGVKGFKCPAASYVYHLFIQNLDEIKNLNFKIEGNLLLKKTNRFIELENKEEIFITIN